MNDEGIKQDMPARVARWADLEGFTGGHPDSGYEGYDRKLYSVIGFGSPDDATSGDPESGKHHVSSPAGGASCGARVRASRWSLAPGTLSLSRALPCDGSSTSATKRAHCL